MSSALAGCTLAGSRLVYWQDLYARSTCMLRTCFCRLHVGRHPLHCQWSSCCFPLRACLDGRSAGHLSSSCFYHSDLPGCWYCYQGGWVRACMQPGSVPVDTCGQQCCSLGSQVYVLHAKWACDYRRRLQLHDACSLWPPLWPPLSESSACVLHDICC